MKIASPIKISEAIESYISSVIKNTPKMASGEKPVTFKSANRYGDSWLAAGKTKCDNDTPPTKE